MSTPSDSVTAEGFSRLIARITASIGARALDQHLEQDLNRLFPAASATYQDIFRSCRTAIANGWMCSREAGGIRYGRVLKPTATTHGYSVDVVDMPPLAGPYHSHPHGEIDLIMPWEAGASFDGRGAGWLVYGPRTAHRPTVTGGRALVLYLLPAGAIEFSGE